MLYGSLNGCVSLFLLWSALYKLYTQNAWFWRELLKEITNKQKTVELQNCTLKKLQWFPDCYELIWKDRIQRSIRIYTSDHHNDCLLTYHVSQALPGFDSLCCMLDMCRDFVLDIPTDASLGYNLTCSSYLKEPNYFIFFLKPY